MHRATPTSRGSERTTVAFMAATVGRRQHCGQSPKLSSRGTACRRSRARCSPPGAVEPEGAPVDPITDLSRLRRADQQSAPVRQHDHRRPQRTSKPKQSDSDPDLLAALSRMTAVATIIPATPPSKSLRSSFREKSRARRQLCRVPAVTSMCVRGYSEQHLASGRH
jgi:hypothetical protein